MMVTLTSGGLAKILAGSSIIDPYLQVTSLHSIQKPNSTITKYRVQLSDGTHSFGSSSRQVHRSNHWTRFRNGHNYLCKKLFLQIDQQLHVCHFFPTTIDCFFTMSC